MFLCSDELFVVQKGKRHTSFGRACLDLSCSDVSMPFVNMAFVVFATKARRLRRARDTAQAERARLNGAYTFTGSGLAGSRSLGRSTLVEGRVVRTANGSKPAKTPNKTYIAIAERKSRMFTAPFCLFHKSKAPRSVVYTAPNICPPPYVDSHPSAHALPH